MFGDGFRDVSGNEFGGGHVVVDNSTREVSIFLDALVVHNPVDILRIRGLSLSFRLGFFNSPDVLVVHDPVDILRIRGLKLGLRFVLFYKPETNRNSETDTVNRLEVF